MAKRWGPVALANEIQMRSVLFHYGYEAELLEHAYSLRTGFQKAIRQDAPQDPHWPGDPRCSRRRSMQLLKASTSTCGP